MLVVKVAESAALRIDDAARDARARHLAGAGEVGPHGAELVSRAIDLQIASLVQRGGEVVILGHDLKAELAELALDDGRRLLIAGIAGHARAQ